MSIVFKMETRQPDNSRLLFFFVRPSFSVFGGGLGSRGVQGKRFNHEDTKNTKDSTKKEGFF